MEGKDVSLPRYKKSVCLCAFPVNGARRQVCTQHQPLHCPFSGMQGEDLGASRAAIPFTI